MPHSPHDSRPATPLSSATPPVAPPLAPPLTPMHGRSETPEQALSRLGLALPAAPNPVAAYVPVKRTGRMLFVSGQIPMRDGKAVAKGTVPTQVPLQTARECAVQCTLNALAAVRAFLGNTPDALSQIAQVVRIGCFVACTPEFTEHPQVANAASELLIAVFGDHGKHARAAVGAPGLPLGVPVEIEFLFELREGA